MKSMMHFLKYCVNITLICLNKKGFIMIKKVFEFVVVILAFPISFIILVSRVAWRIADIWFEDGKIGT